MVTTKVKAIDNSSVAQFSQKDTKVQADYCEQYSTLVTAFYGYGLAHITTCSLCVLYLFHLFRGCNVLC